MVLLPVFLHYVIEFVFVIGFAVGAVIVGSAIIGGRR